MRYSRPSALVHALIVCCCSHSAAQATIWNEIPDAPRVAPGQITAGEGSLLEIRGELTGGLRGGQTDFEDVYCIRITDPAAFSASTIGGATFDTQLWLFAASGLGLVFNDNAATDAGVVLQSRIDNANLQWLAQPGLYLLAISGFDTDAAAGIDTAIWLDEPRDTQRAPDGPGAGGALAAWNPGPMLDDAIGTYVITLTGAEFCLVPAPASGLLPLALGLTAVARRRR